MVWRWLTGITVAVLAAAALSAQQAAANQGPITLDVTGPLIIGFFPPFTEQEAKEDGVIEGLAHVRFVLQDIGKCYPEPSARFGLWVTRHITLRDSGTVREISIPSDWDHAV